MAASIPFFYADLIARMIPGAVFLALIRLTALETPEPWAESIGPGDTVLVPLIYAGLAYLIGTALEVLLSRPLERIYIRAFKAASRTYAWTYDVPKNQATIPVRTAEQLSRASFGPLIVGASEKESQTISHVVRFHSEAKMCFGISVVFLTVLLVQALDDWLGVQLMRTFEQDDIWRSILVMGFPLLLYCTYQRLESRARFILRAVERLGGEWESTALLSLRDELRAFSQSLVTAGG